MRLALIPMMACLATALAAGTEPVSDMAARPGFAVHPTDKSFDTLLDDLRAAFVGRRGALFS